MEKKNERRGWYFFHFVIELKLASRHWRLPQNRKSRYQTNKQVLVSVWLVYRRWLPNVYCKDINLAVCKQLLIQLNIGTIMALAIVAIIGASVVWFPL